MNKLPQPNLDVYDFETALESAFTRALLDGNFIPSVAKQKDSKELITPRAEGRFVTGELNDTQRYTVPGTTNQYPIRWDGIFYLKIVSNRLRDEWLKKHRYAVAAARWIGQNPTLNAAGDRMLQQYLPLHTLTYIREVGTSPGIVTSQGLDADGLSFQIVIVIKPSALPTA